MNEKLMQFIWRYQYFQLTQLESTIGENIVVLHPGLSNSNQGPDFLEAKIKIGETILVGHVELHVKTSDWEMHQHHEDERYANVILHVVWRNDKALKVTCYFATLELQNYVSTILLERYEYLLIKPVKFVPCQNYLPVLSNLSWVNWKERVGVERLRRKSVSVLENLYYYKGDWASVFWEEFAAGFGIKVNTECFRQMARSIPLALIRRQRNNLGVLEALLFGQVGLLHRDFKDAYPQQLKKEYLYQLQKHALNPATIPVAFLRMHPRNFPTIRLAQLAKLLHISAHLFVQIIESESLQYIESLFDVDTSLYWNNHFVFEKESKMSNTKRLGHSMINVLLINCVIPVVYAYGMYRKDDRMQEKALSWLSQITTESNTIIQYWKSYGVTSANALESQALLELFSQYCEPKKCLSCNIGIAYLKHS